MLPNTEILPFCVCTLLNKNRSWHNTEPTKTAGAPQSVELAVYIIRPRIRKAEQGTETQNKQKKTSKTKRLRSVTDSTHTHTRTHLESVNMQNTSLCGRAELLINQLITYFII